MPTAGPVGASSSYGIASTQEGQKEHLVGGPDLFIRQSALESDCSMAPTGFSPMARSFRGGGDSLRPTASCVFCAIAHHLLSYCNLVYRTENFLVAART